MKKNFILCFFVFSYLAMTSYLSAGPLYNPTAIIPINSITSDKYKDASIDLSGSKVVGVVPSTNGGTGQNSSLSTGIPYALSGVWSFKSVSQFLTLIGLNSSDSPTFAGLALMGPLTSGTPDNTHYTNDKNSSSPIGIHLAPGNRWTLPDETLRLRAADNGATNILASAYQYRNFAFDNSAMDNMVLIQNLPFTEVWDNVLYTIRGYTDNTFALSITGTGCQYCKNAEACTSDAGIAAAGDSVHLRITTGGNYSTAYPIGGCTLTAGGVMDSDAPWTATTLPVSSDPSTVKFRGNIRGVKR
jgi:hypothetical protein